MLRWCWKALRVLVGDWWCCADALTAVVVVFVLINSAFFIVVVLRGPVSSLRDRRSTATKTLERGQTSSGQLVRRGSHS